MQPEWPTPSAGGSAGEVSEDLERKGAKLVNKKTGRVLQTNLATEVKWGGRKQLPTPQARDHKTGNGDRVNRDRLAGKRGRTDLPDVIAAENGFGLTDDGQGMLFGEGAQDTGPRKVWGTPRASEHKGSGPKGSKNQKRELGKSSLRAQVTEDEGLPTPTASDWKGRGKGSKHLGLDNHVKNFPTPRSSDAERGPKHSGRQGGPSLPSVINNYPTPQGGGGQSVGMCGGTGAMQMSAKLCDDGLITDEERRSMQSGNGGQLNPDWVSLLMGWPAKWTELDEELERWFCAERKRRTREVLRMRKENASKEVLGSVRGLQRVSKKEILRPPMRSFFSEEEGSQKNDTSMEVSKASEGGVRSVRNKEKTSRSSSGSKILQHGPEESTNAVHLVSQLHTQDNRTIEYEGCGENAKIVSHKVETRKSLEDFFNAWGPTWEDDTPRVSKGIPYRVDRLRLIGNGVCPQQAYPAWLIITILAGMGTR